MKNIIVCLDGLWPTPGQDQWPAAPTNVFRLFVNLDGSDSPDSLLRAGEQVRMARGEDGRVNQAALYLMQGGDPADPLARMLRDAPGGRFLLPLLRGYGFIARHYDPGDRIVLIGFSAGATAARSLAGLIAARGLPDRARCDLKPDGAAERIGAALWQDWRRGVFARRVSVVRALDAALAELPGFFATPTNVPRHDTVAIEAVAVWETVGAQGIPDHFGLNPEIDIHRFADVALPQRTVYGFHALAIDERRADFAPTYWEPDARVLQYLFPGAHEDVGGGHGAVHGESGLSDAALEWMVDNLAMLGLRFAATPGWAAAPDPRGVAHQPWRDPPYTSRAQGPRELPDGLAVARVTRERLAAGPVQQAPDLPARPWRPINLGGYV
ncbi:MAG: DUF2235 domain-containing protein [Alphaproteobacteria bacterium]|nr:DUF2235 domain-containing protein [Alphaproteobacteria bacterium]